MKYLSEKRYSADPDVNQAVSSWLQVIQTDF